MNVDLSYFDFIKKEELKVLTAIEVGMRNHEFVPLKTVERIAKLKRGNTYKVIQTLLKHKLICYQNKKFEGFKLQYTGYDYLALNKFRKHELIEKIEMKIGVGKESDIYLVRSKDEKLMVLKLARLGRSSFKSIKKNRDYLQNKLHYNWLYLSKIASQKEYNYMSILHKNNFPVPVPVAHNRHAILMSFINGFPLNKVKKINSPQIGYNTLMDIIESFAENGLIHSDFNEFNIMIDNDQRIWVIDFPQMVSTNHKEANFYLNRDIKCINDLFERRFNFKGDRQCQLKDLKILKHLDQEVMASGAKSKQELKEIKLLESYYQNQIQEEDSDYEDSDYDKQDDQEISDKEQESNQEECEQEETDKEESEQEEQNYFLDDKKKEGVEKLLLNQQ